MRIATLSAKFPPGDIGGAEISAYNIAKGLARRHDVHVITRRQRLRGEGFRVHTIRCIPKPFILRYLTTSLGMLCRILSIRPDVIYAVEFYSAGLAGALASRILKIPLVLKLFGEIYWISNIMRKKAACFVLRNSALVLALTRHMKGTVLKYAPDARVDILHDGVDYDSFRKSRGHRNPLSILYIGRLIEPKGVRHLIMAFRGVKKALPKARLIIGGYGSQEDELKDLVKKLNLRDVRFIGRVGRRDVGKYMKGSDVFVLPSYSEAFPLSLLEAMASGTPVITTDVRGLPEIIRDGVNGLLVEPRNSGMLADRITYLLQNPEIRKRMSLNNMEEAKKYRWEKIVNETLREINSLVK